LQQGSASPIVQELQKEGVVIDASKNLLDQALQIWNDPGKTSIQAYRSAYDREARAYYEQVMYSLNEVKTDFKRNIAGIPDRVSNLPYFSELGLGTHNYDRTSPVYGM